ncbi:hypothetical protein AV530_014857 [Patagioenas fasciata monilis]|uniref:Uncharacterized protein n=1 Tax=Patagioenas fasciata monilis TaxID=372326 RepID=A0A1V4JGZ2_PATFA|nr:hypothetical protein AV530_014857 [Patagioenas fasciata monilis]
MWRLQLPLCKQRQSLSLLAEPTLCKAARRSSGFEFRDNKQGFSSPLFSLQWLNEAKIIQRLVELIHSSQDEDRQSNASQTLCDIIRLSRDQSNQLQDVPEPDPLLTALES